MVRLFLSVTSLVMMTLSTVFASSEEDAVIKKIITDLKVGWEQGVR